MDSDIIEGFKRTEYEALLVRLGALIEDENVTVVKVKLVYQEANRPNRYDGRSYTVKEVEE